MSDIGKIIKKLKKLFEENNCCEEDIMQICLITGAVHAEQAEVPFQTVLQMVALGYGLEIEKIKLLKQDGDKNSDSSENNKRTKQPGALAPKKQKTCNAKANSKKRM